MKINNFLFLSLLFITLNTYCAEITSDTAPAKGIFDDIERDGFSQLPIINLLAGTYHGRAHLVDMRLGEIVRENIFNGNQAGIHKDLRMVGSSCAYDRDIKTVLYNSKRAISQSNKILRVFSAGIAALEEVFIVDNNPMSLSTKKALEKTRVHDLYLLKTILEQDNLGMVKDQDLYTLPEILYATSLTWPPAHCIEDIHTTSAYDVIKAALEKRKAANIDALDTANYDEEWQVKIKK